MTFSIRLVLLTPIIGVLISACGRQENLPPQSFVPEVDVSTPIKRTITEWDEYTGRFQPVENVEVRARVSGYLQEVRFTDGDKVEEGDVLFVIDQRPFKIALESAEAQYDLSLKELRRAQDLRASRAIAAEDLDRRTNEYKLAKAALDRAKLDMEFTEVKAPVAGRASRRLVDVGNLVTGESLNATLLTTIVSLAPIHFYFESGEQELLKYIRLHRSGAREGSRTAANPIYVKLLDEKDFTHLGFMDFVDNRVDDSTGTIQGRAIFENKEEILTPGMFGRARLLSRAEYEALLVPDDAIGTDQSRKFVYVVDEDNIAKMRVVTTGRLYTTQLRVVEDGLAPDDQIIVSGIQRIRGESEVTANVIDITEEYADSMPAPLPLTASAAASSDSEQDEKLPADAPETDDNAAARE